MTDSQQKIVSLMLRRSLSRQTPQGARDLLVELSQQVGLSSDLTEAFVSACQAAGMTGESSEAVAHRLTVSSALDLVCRSAGVAEPHIDAALPQLMSIGGNNVPNVDARGSIQVD